MEYKFDMRLDLTTELSGVVNLPKVCVICGCGLNGDNRSEVKNVCRRCEHDLEF